MQAADCLWGRLCDSRIRNDGAMYGRRFGAAAVSQKSQHTLFIYNNSELLADEHCLLSETETDSHSRREHHCHRFRDARAHGRSGNRHLGFPLAGHDDIPGHIVPRIDKTQ